MVSVIQILRAVSGGNLALRTLPTLEFLRDESGRLLYCVGNSAVLLRCNIEGVCHSVKCYTSPSEYRSIIYGAALKPREAYVPTTREGGEWIDLLIEEWIEGLPLGEYIESKILARDHQSLNTLSRSFDALALELLSSESAHGDITCDNIIVSESGELHLIDFDGAFRVEMAGSVSLELGTEAYQHPKRKEQAFDRSIDDYSLALISTALSALALDPTLYTRFGSGEGLLLTPLEVVEGRSEVYLSVLDLLSSRGAAFAYVIAKMLDSPQPALPHLCDLMRYKVEGVHPNAAPVLNICKDGLWGFLNEFNRVAIPPLFDEAFSFKESLAAVRLGRYWHYINTQAEVVINCSQYQSITPFKDGCGRALGSEGWVTIHRK